MIAYRDSYDSFLLRGGANEMWECVWGANIRMSERSPYIVTTENNDPQYSINLRILE